MYFFIFIVFKRIKFLGETSTNKLIIITIPERPSISLLLLYQVCPSNRENKKTDETSHYIECSCSYLSKFYNRKKSCLLLIYLVDTKILCLNSDTRKFMQKTLTVTEQIICKTNYCEILVIQL